MGSPCMVLVFGNNLGCVYNLTSLVKTSKSGRLGLGTCESFPLESVNTNCNAGEPLPYPPLQRRP